MRCNGKDGLLRTIERIQGQKEETEQNTEWGLGFYVNR